jgi:hypothetical protein
MSKSVAAGLALALCLGFGGGYVARGSLHPGSGEGAPGSTPSIRPAQEFVSVLTFCAHLDGFAAIERDLRKGRVSDAAKRLKNLSSSLLGDANLFDAAHDSVTANSLRARAGELTSITTPAKLAPVEGALQQTCRDLRTRYPSPSK